MSCTWPISKYPTSTEAGEYWLTRGMFLVARRLEVVAVAGLLWISWCVLCAAGFRLFFPPFFLECTRPAASMRPPCLMYLSTRMQITREALLRRAAARLGSTRARNDRGCMILGVCIKGPRRPYYNPIPGTFFFIFLKKMSSHQLHYFQYNGGL